MAKQTGLGDQLFIGGTDVGADINSIGSLATPVATLEMTGITKFAMERQYGHRDANAEFTAYFNDATDETHDRLKLLPRTDVSLLYLRGTTLGAPAFGLVGKQIDYAGNRGDDGALTFAVNAQSNGFGGDWGRQLTAGKVTHASAANGASLDLGVGTVSFGFQAYVQVFSIGSGTPSLKLQTSSDNGVGDAWADLTGGSFGVVTAPSAVRIQSASDTLAVERYIRVVSTGTFTDLVFAAAVTRNRGQRAI
jgi:hypothetical protein